MRTLYTRPLLVTNSTCSLQISNRFLESGERIPARANWQPARYVYICRIMEMEIKGYPDMYYLTNPSLL
jgi:hypothetical protein